MSEEKKETTGATKKKTVIKRTQVEHLGMQYDRFYGAVLKFAGRNLLKNPGARQQFAEVMEHAQTLEISLATFIALVTVPPVTVGDAAQAAIEVLEGQGQEGALDQPRQ